MARKAGQIVTNRFADARAFFVIYPTLRSQIALDERFGTTEIQPFLRMAATDKYPNSCHVPWRPVIELCLGQGVNGLPRELAFPGISADSSCNS